jgi:hypothetical protein
MSLIDKARFEARGGNGCSNSHYVLQRTTCCGSFAVEDTELADLYTDPGDLRKTLVLMYDPSAGSPPLCPFCNTDDWDFREVEDIDDVPPAWHWATKRGATAMAARKSPTVRT